jgi:hypothetical protein
MDGRERGREGIVPRKRVGRQGMLHWRISVRFIKLSYVRILRGWQQWLAANFWRHVRVAILIPG